MAEYPATVPNLLDRFALSGLAKDDWVAKLEEDQAVFDALGPMPAGPYGTVANAIVELSQIAATFGSFAHRNLRIRWASDTTVAVTADLLAVEGQLVTNLSLTLDVTASGALGTASSRATSKWFYVWVGVNPTTGLATGQLDDTHLRSGLDTSHADFAGFTAWVRIGAVRTNATGSGNFIPFTQEGARVVYGDPLATAYAVIGPDITVGSGSPGTYAPANVPPVARHIDLGSEAAAIVVTAAKLFARPAGTTFGGVPILAIPIGGTGNSGHFGRARVAVSTSAQEINAWWTAAPGSTGSPAGGQSTAVFYTLGYDDSFLQ